MITFRQLYTESENAFFNALAEQGIVLTDEEEILSYKIAAFNDALEQANNLKPEVDREGFEEIKENLGIEANFDLDDDINNYEIVPSTSNNENENNNDEIELG